jgi:hypothetical protein
MSSNEVRDPSIGTPPSDKLIQALAARIKESQTPAPMATDVKEDGSNKPDNSTTEDDVDDHFIPTILRNMGGHLSASHVKCIAVTLFTIGIGDMDELLEIDQQAPSDICRHEDDLSYMHQIRTRKFLCHIGSPHFKMPGEEGDQNPFESIHPEPFKRAARRSSLIMPSDFAAVRNLESDETTNHGVPAAYHRPLAPVQIRTRHSQALRYIGGTSARQYQTDLFAASGGGPGGLGADVNIHHVKSADALEAEKKILLKLEVNAEIVLPKWDGTVSGWREFSKDFLRLMTKVGHDIVCRPEFTTTAQGIGWTPKKIVEARKFVWGQLFAACKDVVAAKNALSLAGPEYDGETAFHQLEIDNKISSRVLKDLWSEELRLFKPEGREDPSGMMVRYDLLLTSYLELESADPWDPEKKIDHVLTLLRNWDGLKTNVDMQRERLTDPSTILVEHIPHDQVHDKSLMSYTQVCRKARSIWNSFAVTDAKRTAIHRAAIQGSSSGGASNDNSSGSQSDTVTTDQVQLQILETLTILSTKLLAEDASQKTPATPKGGKPAKNVKSKIKCLSPSCGEFFQGFSYQQVCGDCFEKAKADRGLKIALVGTRAGTDFTGKSIYITDSSNPKHRSRGGWKISIQAIKIRMFFQHGFQPPQPQTISTLSTLGKDFCHYEPLFMGADSCAGGSATGIAELIHGEVTPLNWVIEGMKADALVPVEGSCVAVYLVQDKFTDQELILHSGGMLKCDPNLVSTTVTSSSQVGHFYNANKGRQGAQFHTANPVAGYMQLPNGHAVDFHVNDDEAFGYMATPIHPNDPRMKSCTHMWISEDCVYRPPGRYTMLPVRVNDQLCRLRYGDDATVERFHILRQKIKICEASPYFAMASKSTDISSECASHEPPTMPDKLVENDVEDLASSAVETVLEEPAMGKYVYTEPLSDSSEDMAILQHIWGGSGAGPILATMTHGHGGKQMLSKAGFDFLESFNTRFSFPAAGMSSHKLHRNAKMDRDRDRFRNPVGFRLVTDTLHLGFPAPMFGHFQLFCDSRVKSGNVYAMWNKTGDAYLSTLKEHVSLFAKPPRLQEVASDADPALIRGPAKEWMLSKCIKTTSGAPHVPGTSLIERKYVRHFSNVLSHLMLDSQLPLRFLETVGQMACLIISYLHIEFEGRDTTSHFEMFKTEPDLRTLKRVGCEAFWLLLKKDRIKYGSKGVRGVFVGIAAHTHPEWTYIVWSPLTNNLYFRRDVLFNQSPMPFRDARTLITTATSGPMSLRRGIATCSRSEFRDATEDYNLDHFDVNGDPESPFSDLGAPAFLPVHDHASSPIQSGDTLFVGDSPTVVTSVSPQMIRSQNLITNTFHETSPTARFFKDSSNLLTRSRYTTRFRTQAAFFTYNRLGGENDTQVDPSESKDDVCKQDGSDLIGSQFWDSPSEEEMPKSFTVIGTKTHVTGGIQYKMLEYQLTEELGVSGADVESSRVFEVRNWMDHLPPETTTIETPTAPTILPIEEPTSMIEIDDDDVGMTTNSLFTTDGIGELAIADGPLEKDEVAAVLRLKIRNFKIARKPAKIPQRVVKKI